MTENDSIELYCIVDDSYQKFIETKVEKRNLSLYYDKCAPKRRMSVTDVMTLNLLKIFVRTDNLKIFHKLAVFLQYILYYNRKNCKETVFYLYSTPVTVYENRYISSHKVAKAVASRGKSTKGWFYGFKLQSLCTKMEYC